MLFPTVEFAVFFAVVFVVSWLLRPRPTAWKLFSLAASYFFYGWWDWGLLWLLALLTVANQVFAGGAHRASTPRARKTWVAVAVVFDLGILGWFKYYGFFVENLTELAGLVGATWAPPLLTVVLPIGISFIVFQSISYVVDCSRHTIRPAKLLDVGVYLSYFPHVLAGPLVRANEFIPQLYEPADPRRIDSSRAFRLIVQGMFKKVVVSTYLATAIVDPIFAAPQTHSSLEVLLGVYAYAFVIYCDFSGYTDIAIGIALLLGIKFPQNFDAPYTARSVQDFWRRWHMTLSRWLRDYLYVPLGGNRGGELATYRNLILTMVLGGLWHGASWNFIVWGLLHGIGLAVTRYYQRVCQVDRLRGQRLLLGCACVFFAGAALHGSIGRALIDDTWLDLTLMWLYTVPVWAAATVWLTRGEAPPVGQTVSAASAADLVLVLRAIGGAAVIGLMLALHEGVHWAWLPFALVSLIAAWAADVAEVNPSRDGALRWLGWAARRAIAVVLVFHYVCLAWVFFRAQTFDGALAVLARLGAGETDHPNLIAPIQLALVVAAGAHFFAPRTLAWWRARFVSAPTWAQGLVLAGCAEALRGLAVPHIVPFIYFQF